MRFSPPRSFLQIWPWVAGVGAGALLWIGSCALFSDPRDAARGQAAPARERPRSDSSAEIAALRLALDREIGAREQLAMQVASLRSQLEAAVHAPANAADPRGSVDATGPAASAQRPVFDREALVAAGIAPSEAQDLRERWETAEMEKIRLTDRATREGWLNSAQYQEELRTIDGELRGGLDEQAYDRFLYATGKTNRARISDVIAESPAAEAGFRVGDTILSYDGKRIFSIEEIRTAATSSHAGASVPVQVEHGGTVETLYVPGGPMGLVLVPDREKPR